MNQDLKQKSIASWANHYENARYKVWVKNSLLHKPMEINGCIPDVFAMRKGQSIAVCKVPISSDTDYTSKFDLS